MNIAVFGGAFNPIHTAHIGLVNAVLKSFDIDKIIFMPTYESPHKDTTKSVSYSDRMNMCRLAVNEDDRFIISDLESRITGKSYSYITLSKLKELYPDDKLYMIIGADMYLSLMKWKNPEKIFKLATIITCPRDEGDYKSLYEYSENLSEYGCSTLILKSPIMKLSSTMIRNNPDTAYENGWLNKKVYEYIKQHKLYEVE